MKIPCESSKFKGFFEIPWTRAVVISADGVVINTTTGEILKPVLRNHGYYSVNLVVEGREKQYLVHRLLAGAFMPIPKELEGYKRLQVNHLDGVKTNNVLENLEWIRPQQNMHHAFKNRLIDIGYKVLARHVLTDEVTSYNSVSELAIELDISAKMLRRHLESSYAGKQSIDWRVFKYDDNSSWPEIPSNWLNPTTFNIKTAFLIKDLETGMVLLSKSLKTFCEVAGIVYEHLKNHRKHNGPSVVFRKRWDIKEVENIAVVKVDEFLDFSLRGSAKDRRIFEVTDKDQQTFVVTGLVELARTIGYDYAYVANIIAKGGERIAEFMIKNLSNGQTGVTLPKV